MGKSIVNFRRREKKYLITKSIYGKLISSIGEYIEKDKFGDTIINNIYLDTDDYLMTRRSIEKPDYKEKLRVRGYQDLDSNSKVFLEVKKKYDGMGYKKRIKLELGDLNRRILEKDYSLGNTHIAKELGWCLKRYEPKPKIYVGYERISYKGVGVSPLRITFDSNVVYRTDDLKLESGFHGKHILNEDLMIMEIKTTEGIPSWLTNVLNELKIYPKSFSKVGNAYKKELETKSQDRKEVQ